MIQIEELKGLPFCAQIGALNWEYRNWDYNAMLQNECMRKEFSLNAIYECNGALSSLMMTCAGLAACYIPEDIFHLLRCRQVHLKRVAGINAATTPILLWNSAGYTSRCLRLFLDYFKDHFSAQ